MRASTAPEEEQGFAATSAAIAVARGRALAGRAKRTPTSEPPAPDPGGVALRHLGDCDAPGITRRRSGRGFSYRYPDGRVIRDAAQIARIRQLAIPPAWVEVWISPCADSHLQATGRDARGRKQYLYHPAWTAQRGADKFARMAAFGHALPRIRRRVARDLASDDGRKLSYPLVMATLVRLLDTTFLRVGNEAYARENQSFGLTTLRNRHVRLSGETLRLAFRGKHGVEHRLQLSDRRIARIVRRCKQLPGQALFHYEADGESHRVDSGDVNDYISSAAGERFTAKDFRTWHGSVQALELCLAARETAGSTRSATRCILESVASQLGNTVAVCRKSYVHPAILTLAEEIAKATKPAPSLDDAPDSAARELRIAERRLMRFLEQLATANVPASN